MKKRKEGVTGQQLEEAAAAAAPKKEEPAGRKTKAAPRKSFY